MDGNGLSDRIDGLDYIDSAHTSGQLRPFAVSPFRNPIRAGG
jgi:hypothetical protein